MGHLSVGDAAPDFTLPGTDGAFTLSEHRGRRVVLLFYPGDDTSVCTKQFCDYRDHAEDLAALPAVVVGISGADKASKDAFHRKYDLNVPLLADEDGAVATAYDMDSKVMGVKRGTVIVDETGTVAYVHSFRFALKYKTVDDLREILEQLPAPGIPST
ncbi:peroxiredoxin [Paraconexibacter algicola]|uniref:thioredoxin-dependent peroxiredoxin n=1 Tax=Paraconexibacter algicola TaxID=2133960 RepID=A0A2T4UMF3_9ACTN|nr:peroxiredoxin [Paraconexibacter algicola]PTL60413.1 peroxiredoxin [Paraconexibacter algicola]